jgi:hypothetical protein
MGYEPQFLEARLALSQIELRSDRSSTARQQIEQIAKEADSKGLKLIAYKARSLLK